MINWNLTAEVLSSWQLSRERLQILVDDVNRTRPDGILGWKPSTTYEGTIEWTHPATSFRVIATPGWCGEEELPIEVDEFENVHFDNDLVIFDGEPMTPEHYVDLVMHFIWDRPALRNCDPSGMDL